MKSILTAASLLIAISCSPATGKTVEAQSGGSVLERLVQALNLKDSGKLKEFVLANFDDPNQADSHVGYLSGIVPQGAPFKFVKDLPSAPGRVMAVIEDREGLLLAFEGDLTPPPASKLARIMIRPYEETPVKDYSGFKSLQSLADDLRSDAKAPALGICRVQGAKTEVAVAGSRTVGGPKVGPDEPWSIGSVGKPICSTIIGRLVEEGKLTWTSKLSELIPELVKGTPYGDVTIQQLLEHRSGVASETRFTPEMVQRLAGAETNPTKLREKFAMDILSREPLSVPGAKFEYSNGGYVLLGVIAEKLTAKPYETLVRDWIFSPLGLKNSYTYGDQLPAARPSGHGQMPDGLRPMNMDGPVEAMLAPAGGGLFMSLSDLAAFGAAHLKGLQGKDGLLKSATIKRLHQSSGQPAGPNLDYALGWGLEKHPGLETMHGHNGSNGTMHAQLAIFPDLDLVVVSAMNVVSMANLAPTTAATLAVARSQKGG